MYHVTLHNGGGTELVRVAVDGAPQVKRTLMLVDDRREHDVDFEFGPARPEPVPA